MQRIPETVCEFLRALTQEGKRARARATTHISLFRSCSHASVALQRKMPPLTTLEATNEQHQL